MTAGFVWVVAVLGQGGGYDLDSQTVWPGNLLEKSGGKSDLVEGSVGKKSVSDSSKALCMMGAVSRQMAVESRMMGVGDRAQVLPKADF